MRPPRLLALLIVLAALLATGAWWFVRSASTNARSAEREDAPASGAMEQVALESPSVPHSDRSSVVRGATAADAPSSTRIRGRVVHGSEDLPVAGLVVHALPGQGLGAQLSQRLPAIVQRTSGADGRFEFEDCSPERIHTLIVGGLGTGWFLGNPVHTRPSEEELLLRVKRLYSASLRALGEDGHPPTRHVAFLEVGRAAGQVEGAAEILSQSAPDTVGGAAYRIQLMSADDLPRLGPFHVRITCPGYETRRFEFWAQPEEQPAHVTELQLVRNAEVFGTLALNAECGCSDRACYHGFSGQLVLQPADRSQSSLAFEVTGHARVRANTGGFCFPRASEQAADLVIGAGRTDWRVPVSNLGEIRWEVRDPDGNFSNASMTLECKLPGGAEHPNWCGSMDVYTGLEAGTREFHLAGGVLDKLEGGSFSVAGDGYDLRVDVVAGESRTVVMHVR